jgi:hypothetical protein
MLLDLEGGIRDLFEHIATYAKPDSAPDGQRRLRSKRVRPSSSSKRRPPG